MSDSPADQPPERVSMTKSPSGAKPKGMPKDEFERPPLPKTLKAAIASLVGLCVAHLLNLWGVSIDKAAFYHYVETDAAAKKAIAKDVAKAISDAKKAHKTPKTKAEYTAHYVHQAVTSIPAEAIVQTVFLVLISVMVVFMMLRVRMASGSRWILLIGMIFTTQPFYLRPIPGFPALAKYSSVAIGVFSIAAIVLVLLPESGKYFRACRDLVRPPVEGAAPRPSLFGPRRPVGAAGGARPGTRPAQTRPAATTSGSSAKARSKVRADAESVARGAELARSRAKAASKSRRTDR